MCIKSIKVCIHRELYFTRKSWRMSQFRSNSYCPNEKNKQMIKFGKTTETVTKYDAESIARFMGQALKHSRIEYRLILYLVLYYWALQFLALLKLYQPIFLKTNRRNNRKFVYVINEEEWTHLVRAQWKKTSIYNSIQRIKRKKLKARTMPFGTMKR